MRERSVAFIGVVVVAIVAVWLMPASVAGQAARPAAQTHAYVAPRTADGHPDLQGTYDIATLTPLERAAGTPLVMTKDEAARKTNHDCIERAALRASEGCPPSAATGRSAPRETSAATKTLDRRGTQYFQIDGRSGCRFDRPAGWPVPR
jgi:hypothetical protein